MTKATKGKPGKAGLTKVPPPSLIARPPGLIARPAGYAEWLAEVKARVHAAQQRAALAANHELLRLYWGIGRDILERQAAGMWGDGILDQVSADLRTEFPAMKGFSRSNLKYMRAFAEAWSEPEFGQQPVGQIPWGHNLVLLTKLKDRAARLAYAARALDHGWSRAVLVHHIEARTVERQGKALTNFAERLPKPQSDLARETLKDPYRFDFLGIGDEADERQLEGALVQHITRFLLELGAGFAYVGRQVHLEVGGEDFYLSPARPSVASAASPQARAAPSSTGPSTPAPGSTIPRRSAGATGCAAKARTCVCCRSARSMCSAMGSTRSKGSSQP